MKKLFSLILVLSLLLPPAFAAQHDYVIDNAPGATVRSDMNSVLQAIVTNNSGSTAPAVTYPNMFWYDTSTSILKKRTNADDAWEDILSSVDGSKLTGLANIVSGAGVIPVANLPVGTTANKIVQLDGSAKLPAVDGSALTNTGNVAQVVNYQTGAVATGTTAIPFDDSVPQISEGSEVMTLAITPKSDANILKIDVVAHISQNQNAHCSAALFQDSTANALATTYFYTAASSIIGNLKFTYYMTAGTVSETTFKVRVGDSSGTTYTFNGAGGARKYGGVLISSITITEYKV